jgi:REP element-mobilizing transposase RayT
MPRLPHYLADGYLHHTISRTRGGNRVFEDGQNAKAVVDAIRFVTSMDRAYVLACAVMPDHLHLLVASRISKGYRP